MKNRILFALLIGLINGPALGADLEGMILNEEMMSPAPDLDLVTRLYFKRINCQDPFDGNTALHNIINPQIRRKLGPQAPCPELDSMPEDTKIACIAATMIHGKADVAIRNKQGKTPLAIAAEHAGQFPQTNEVLAAAWVVQSWNPPVPKPQDGSHYSLQELVEIGQNLALRTCLQRYQRAQKTLGQYWEKTRAACAQKD